MAVPKRRTSKERKNKRRSHHALSVPTAAVCSHCSQAKASHRICPHCGYYKGRRVVIVE